MAVERFPSLQFRCILQCFYLKILPLLLFTANAKIYSHLTFSLCQSLESYASELHWEKKGNGMKTILFLTLIWNKNKSPQSINAAVKVHPQPMVLSICWLQRTISGSELFHPSWLIYQVAGSHPHCHHDITRCCQGPLEDLCHPWPAWYDGSQQ